MKTLLDHGYLKLVETWGSDKSIIEAARMSTNKGFKGWGTPEEPGDEKLLRYLYTNNHATPFEMAGFILEVKAPIMVFREWMRHRVQSFNEMSARYTPLPDENYLPTPERCLEVSSKNKQAGKIKGAGELTHADAIAWLGELEATYNKCQQTYERGLQLGIPKELARLPVPVARYSRMRASANLRNWLAFMTLRSAPNAQKEIRVYSEAIGELVEIYYPRTWELFQERFYG